ncbi:unnamed protein product [Paramecium primaurelia]|uniref:ubiquitinyl hydrolase 1 n=1 Tax=Paramecium primaurelia TaxID=5886 RepID=A0A8S1N158_PARPR|nr:unnamed protein product [Paramecium primaurelia]
MKTQINQKLLDQYAQMGFSLELINMAWEIINMESEMMDTLLTLSIQNQKVQIKQDNQDEEILITQALVDSYQTNQQIGSHIFELVSPEQKKRVDRIPCRLKNIGNTCYFNSLLQTYFFNSQFVKTIITFQPQQQGKQNKSIQLVLNLQNLFIKMIGSDQKYADPSEVVKSICDDFGNVLPIGDQQDVGEFNHYFLSRIGEGLAQIERKSKNIVDSQIYTSSSIFKQKSSIINEEDIVSQLFLCKIFHQFQFEQGGYQQIRESTELFNFIPLDLKDGNLYDSFDSFVVNNIDDFKNDFNEIVQAVKYNWIQSPPQKLSFQIQRVTYCKQKNELIKQNDEFTFDEEIYLDRFLIENREKYLNIRNQNKELKIKQKKIQLSQQQLTKFNDGKDLQDVIVDVIQFLQMQNKLFNNLQLKKQSLQKLIDELEIKIQSNYNDLKKHKYLLQSILIHDGQANSGHFYTYIKDFGFDKWFKFNDMNVNVETKQKVFQDAFGMQNGINAYLLIYNRLDIVKQELQSQMRTYRISSENQYLNDIYGSYLNQKQKEQLVKENKLFLNEINQQISLRVIDQLIECYSIRFEFINEQYRIISSSVQSETFKPLITLNFPIFIKSKMAILGQDNYENILKWVIIDSALREVNPDKSGYFGLQINKNFENYLIDKFKDKFNEFKRPSRFLSLKEQDDFHLLFQEYIQYIAIASLASILFDNLLQQHFSNSLSVLHHFSLLAKQLDSQNYFYKLAQNFQRLIPIIIICKMIPFQAIVNLQELQLLQAYLSFQHFKDHQTYFWETQTSIMMNAVNENHNEPQIQNIINKFEKNIKDPNFIKKIEVLNDDISTQQTTLSNNYDIYQWIPNIKKDILFDKLINSYNNLKAKFAKFIKIQKAIQESSNLLMKQEIEDLIV